MGDSITLRLSEQRRVQVLMQLAGGEISSGQAAELLSPASARSGVWRPRWAAMGRPD